MSRTETINSFDKGFFNFEGLSRPNVERYFLRWDDNSNPKEITRSFYAFDLSGIVLGEDDTIVGVKLMLFLPDAGYRSPNEREHIAVHVVPRSDIDRVLQGGRQGAHVFDSLADGKDVGRTWVQKEDAGGFVQIQLDEMMIPTIDEVRNGDDTRLILSGRFNLTPPQIEGNRMLFLLTDEDDPVQLNIDIDEF